MGAGQMHRQPVLLGELFGAVRAEVAAPALVHPLHMLLEGLLVGVDPVAQVAAEHFLGFGQLPGFGRLPSFGQLPSFSRFLQPVIVGQKYPTAHLAAPRPPVPPHVAVEVVGPAEGQAARVANVRLE